MKYIYEEIITESGSEIIKRTDENGEVSWVPKDPANSDYQRYLNSDAEESGTL